MNLENRIGDGKKVFNLNDTPKLVYNTLKKFKKGAIIETDLERAILERYYSTGMVTFSITGKGEGTAKLTTSGRWFLRELEPSLYSRFKESMSDFFGPIRDYFYNKLSY